MILTQRRVQLSKAPWSRIHLILFLVALALAILYCSLLAYQMIFHVEHVDSKYDLRNVTILSFGSNRAYFNAKGQPKQEASSSQKHRENQPNPPSEIRQGMRPREVTSENSTMPAMITHSKTNGAGEKTAHEQQLLQNQQQSSIIAPEPMFHLVFSTGCSSRQDWQSYAFFYHAMQYHPHADVTRIASGCDNDTNAQSLFDTYIKPMSPHHFHLHLTQDYGDLVPGDSYKYFNKPHGMLHWMTHALHMNDTVYTAQIHPYEDTIIVLLDPDQLIVRPFVMDYEHEVERYHPGPILHRRVSHGHPMAQRYGFGDSFTETIDWKNLFQNLTIISEPSQLYLSLVPNVPPWDEATVEFHYVAGPPYLATARDWWKIVQLWSELVVPMYINTREFLTEMYAYSAATYLLQMPHQLMASFMVSNVDSSGEAWQWIDAWERDEVCRVDTTHALPHVLHFCQRYHQGPWFFSKYNLPTEFVSCDHPLLKVPNSSSSILDYSTSTLIDGQPVRRIPPLHRKRYSFMLCHMLTRLNRVATYYKDHHCPNGRANYEKSYVWPQFRDRPLPDPIAIE